MKKVLALLVSAVLTVSAVSAVDFTEFGGGIQPGNFLIGISGNVGYLLNDSYFSGANSFAAIGGVSLGAGVTVDYALPVVALTVGLETGFSFTDMRFLTADTGIGVIPIVAGVGYHPNLGITGLENLDVYASVKLGVGIGFWTGKIAEYVPEGLTNPVGFAFGVDVGATYYFTQNIGAFIEGGYDDILFAYKVASTAMKLSGSTFGRVGLALKF